MRRESIEHKLRLSDSLLSQTFQYNRHTHVEWNPDRSVFRRLRPYHAECTGSRPITEVKQRRAGSVLGWVTAWEHPVLKASFYLRFFLLLLFFFIDITWIVILLICASMSWFR